MFTIYFVHEYNTANHATVEPILREVEVMVNNWILANYNTYTVTDISPPQLVDDCVVVAVNYVRQRD